jgi:cytochrome c oxidase assembly protein subunit 15
MRAATAFFALTLVSWCQIAFGGLVRGNQAGLSCPDWPLCHGALVPDLRLQGVVYEYGHRLFATVVSAVYLLGAFLVLRHPGLREKSRNHVILLGFLLMVQAALGGLTVLLVQRGDGAPRPQTWTVVAHLVLGNIFALLALLQAQRLRAAARVEPPARAASARARWLVGFLVASLGAQVVLGGALAGSVQGLACAEFPTCNGGVFVPTLDGWVGAQLLHRGNALVLLTLGFMVAWRVRGPGIAGVAARALPVLLLAQVAVGALNVWTWLRPEVTALHSLVAALLFSTAGVLAVDQFQAQRP